ncbi:MAG: hypothetical protein U0003_03200 [Vampirovibrionales bacterium]
MVLAALRLPLSHAGLMGGRWSRLCVPVVLAATVSLVASGGGWAAVPVSQVAAFSQAQALYAKGDIQGAIEKFQQVVSSASGSDEANLWMAKALMKQGGDENYAQAKNYLIQALTLNADNPEALMHLGTITGWDPSRRQQAIRLLTRALELKDRSPEVTQEAVPVTQNLVQLLMWDGRYTDAAQYAEPIRQEFAKTPASQAVYASLLSHLGKAPLAVPLYENYIKPLDIQPPTTQSVQWQLDYLYALRYADQQAKARQLFGQVQSHVLANGDANLLNALAGVAYDLNEFMTSVALVEKLPPEMKANRDVQLRNARAFIKLQQWPEAVNTFDRLYQLGDLTAEEKLEFAEVFRGQNLPDSAFPKARYVDGLFRDVASNPKYENDPDIQPRLKAYFDGLNANASSSSASSSWSSSPKVAASDTTEWSVIKPGRSAVARPIVKANGGKAVVSAPRYVAPSAPVETAVRTAPEGAWGTRTETQSTESLWHSDPWTGSSASSENRSTYSDGKVTIQSDRFEWSGGYNAPVERKTEGRSVESPSVVRQSSRPAEIQPVMASDGSLQGRIEQAKQLSYDRHYGESFALFDAILREEPNNREARLGKAMALLYSGRKFQAKSLLSELNSQYPGDPEVITSMAEMYQMMGRQDKAIELLRDLEPGGFRPVQRVPVQSATTTNRGGLFVPSSFSDAGVSRPVSRLCGSCRLG